MSDRMLDLGNGLEIWKVQLDELREQDVNARVMPTKMFERLTTTIHRDGRLESLPFVALNENGGLEIVSGHHRTRAARSAGVNEIYAIVDTTHLSRDEIKAKQLAHNSINGQDNAQIVKQIYQEIQDADSKLEAFIDSNIDIDVPKVKINDITLDVDLKQILVVFLPTQAELFDKAAEKIVGEYDELYVAENKVLEPFIKAVRRIGNEYDIRSMGTVFTRMAEIANEYMGEEIKDEETVAIRDIFGSAYIPKEAADTVIEAVKKLEANGDIKKSNKWQALEYFAASVLAEP